MTLYALGTRHNNLQPSGPYELDVRTAVALALRQFFPVLMLSRCPMATPA